MKQKKSELTKQRILEAAEAEFSEKGVFGARIDSIAASAGVNKRMIYEYFLNKEGLYKTVLINVYNRISLWESSLAGDTDDPVKVIRDLVHSYFEFLTKNQSFVRILLWENLNGAVVLKDSGQSDLKAVVLQLISRVIADGKARGVFRDDADEYQVTMSLLNFAFSYFANVHTLSYVLSSDLLDEAKINERAGFISDILIKYLTA
ncbi:MAG: TetR family transcriptional regulator [Clostridia bacterium]|nr:TetR family transcriptional regulator [Clostridia bacterium]